jgi:hypothetical protein
MNLIRRKLAKYESQFNLDSLLILVEVGFFRLLRAGCSAGYKPSASLSLHFQILVSVFMHIFLKSRTVKNLFKAPNDPIKHSGGNMVAGESQRKRSLSAPFAGMQPRTIPWLLLCEICDR